MLKLKECIKQTIPVLLTGVFLISCEKWDKKPDNVDQLNTQVKGMIKDYTAHIPYRVGIAVAIVQNGQVIIKQNYGTVKPSTNEGITDASLFPLASATKFITTVAIMKALEENRLDLNQPIDDFISDIPQSWRGISIKNLLTHTDGIKDGFENLKMAQLTAEQKEQILNTEYIQYAAELPVNFQYGKGVRYGQTGFVLLSHILEKIYNKSYEQIITEKIFQPIGMQQTYFTTYSSNIDGYRPYIYEPSGGSFVSILPEYTHADYATAAMSSSLGDIIKLMQAIQQHKILSAQTLRLLSTPTHLTKSFALGWEYNLRSGHVVTGHSGGWSVVLTYIPQYNTSVIFLSNTSDAKLLKLGYDLADKTLQYVK